MAPYLFDWEHGIALHAMQQNRVSSPGEGDVSWDFSSCGRNLGCILKLQEGWPFETPLEVLVESGLTSSVKDRESALIFRGYGGHGVFLDFMYCN